MSQTRHNILTCLAQTIQSLRVDHPIRVAIDGRSAAGKTTLADELGEVLRGDGRQVIRASIDDFHRPGHKYRGQRGEWTPELYYEEGFDYLAFRDLLLKPLGPTGDRRYCAALFDAFHDESYPETWEVAGEHSIAVIDAAFSLRPELATEWDYVVWVEIDFETMIARARKRDSVWVGSEEVVAERYRNHWIPTHELYERREAPRARADVFVDNRAFDAPRLIFPERSSSNEFS